MIRWITNDFGIKLISLFLAVGLWYYAVGEESIAIKRNIPLEVIVQNSQMSLLKASTKNVQVTLVAPRAMLTEMTSPDIKAVHKIGTDLKAAGEYSFRLEAQEISIPNPQIRVESIEPAYIVVTVDEVIVKKLSVQPDFVGDPAFGYKVTQEEIQLDPNAILVEGPKGELEKMDSAKTERIDLVGRIRSFRRTAKLELPPTVKPLSEALIDVFVPIKEEYIDKNLENVPVKIVRGSESSAEKKVELTPSKVTVLIQGSKKALEKVTPETLFAYIDISALVPGDNQVPVAFMLPDEVQLKDSPPQIKATLKGK